MSKEIEDELSVIATLDDSQLKHRIYSVTRGREILSRTIDRYFDTFIDGFFVFYSPLQCDILLAANIWPL